MTVDQLLTQVPELRLTRLTAADAVEYELLAGRMLDALGERNVASQWSAWGHDFATQPPDAHERFGIRLRGRLIGRIDLLFVEPPRYGLSYWLDRDAVGHGYATASARAVVGRARFELGASELFAGVAPENARSIAVLDRLGFEPVARLETHVRYRLAFAPA